MEVFRPDGGHRGDRRGGLATPVHEQPAHRQAAR